MPIQSERKKRIAVVIPKYGLTGGAERFAATLTEHLAQNPAYDIHVFANRWASLSNATTFHHVPIISFPRFLTSLSFAWFAQRAVQRGHYDIIHTHDRIFHADLFSMHGVPHSFWTREIRGKRPSLFDRVTAWVEKRVLTDPTCKFFLPVSTLAQEQYQREFPEAGARFQVVPPGVDLERFSPCAQEEKRQGVREQFHLEDSDVVVLFVGMNFELKGLSTLIAALAEVRAKRPERPIKVLVAGKGDQDRFRKIAARAGVEDAVIFAGVQNQGIEKFYAASDIHALLSSFDTFGMTVLEAMAAGLPVIISHNVGAKDLVVDGVHGYIVDKNSITEVADRILALLDDHRRHGMGQAARRVAESHAWTHVAQTINRLYDDILASR